VRVPRTKNFERSEVLTPPLPHQVPAAEPITINRQRSAVDSLARWERAGVRVLRSTQFERSEVHIPGGIRPTG